MNTLYQITLGICLQEKSTLPAQEVARIDQWMLVSAIGVVLLVVIFASVAITAQKHK